MNCQASEFAHTQGASLHPASSSICTAAILDGLMGPSGGELVLTAVGPVEQYTGVAYNGVSELVVDLHKNSFKDDPWFQASTQWTTPGRARVDSCIDAVDYAYSPEIQQYSFHMYLVGFKTGAVLLDGCKDVEGANFGNEAFLAECAAENPPATCLEHDDDVVIKCTNMLAGAEPEAGTIRIVGPTGTPAPSGLGRLQFYNKGREASLSQCPHAVGDDIYCVHAEDVVVACEGDGDPSGVGAFHKEEAVVQKKRFLSLIHLTCFDSLETRQGLGGPPGTMHLVVCPPNCRQVKTMLHAAPAPSQQSFSTALLELK
ncbi:scavenger receptor protein SR2, putative [Eimeria praecox]|uniref:Scavenger receptor protein SR2, putative n=1 Tax=Eimeria praecox TaxID=51316 RepID=U6H1K7_9EIME|nr:scavenger receptor protein SR2, putative [Eimeria praecox]